MARKDKRRKSVVDARVQWTLAGRVIMHFCLFICAGMFFGLIFQYLSNPLGTLTEHMATFWKQSAPLLAAMLCMLPVFVRDTLTLSNRIVGPICRLRDTVRRLGNGEDVPPLKFRKKDMWDDLPGLFNHMLSELRSEKLPDWTVSEIDRDEPVSGIAAHDAPQLAEV